MGLLRLASIAMAVFHGGYSLVSTEVAADVVRAMESQIKGDLCNGSLGLQQQPSNALDACLGDFLVYRVSHHLAKLLVKVAA